jgi:hypothetical protein
LDGDLEAHAGQTHVEECMRSTHSSQTFSNNKVMTERCLTKKESEVFAPGVLLGFPFLIWSIQPKLNRYVQAEHHYGLVRYSSVDSIRSYCDSEFKIEQPVEDWEKELHAAPPIKDRI